MSDHRKRLIGAQRQLRAEGNDNRALVNANDLKIRSPGEATRASIGTQQSVCGLPSGGLTKGFGDSAREGLGSLGRHPLAEDREFLGLLGQGFELLACMRSPKL